MHKIIGFVTGRECLKISGNFLSIVDVRSGSRNITSFHIARSSFPRSDLPALGKSEMDSVTSGGADCYPYHHDSRLGRA